MEQIIKKIVTEIENRTTGDKPLIVAIDGRCAAGKTTIAACLQSKIDCNVFHMDDFFLRMEQRIEERLLEPGGNVDYERFLTEVLAPLSKRMETTYRPYSCQVAQFLESVSTSAKAINIVEGAYSCHPALWQYYDLRIFLTVDKTEQMQRILERNGAKQGKIFESKWIPLEEMYFSAFHVEERCDFCFEGNEQKEGTIE